MTFGSEKCVLCPLIVLSHSSSDQKLQCFFFFLTSAFGSSMSLVFQSLYFYAISRILNIVTGCLKLKSYVLDDALKLS